MNFYKRTRLIIINTFFFLFIAKNSSNNSPYFDHLNKNKALKMSLNNALIYQISNKLNYSFFLTNNSKLLKCLINIT